MKCFVFFLDRVNFVSTCYFSYIISLLKPLKLWHGNSILSILINKYSLKGIQKWGKGLRLMDSKMNMLTFVYKSKAKDNVPNVQRTETKKDENWYLGLSSNNTVKFPKDVSTH